MMTGRTPEKPLASELARSSIMARVTSSAKGSPTPTACERSKLICNLRMS